MLYLSGDLKKINFAIYFEKYKSPEYVSRWPECYAGESPNTNMSLEHFHSEFKSLHMKRGQSHRVDAIIQMLLDKTDADLDRQIYKIVKNPRTTRDHQVAHMHEKGAKIPPNDIASENGSWLVTSQSHPDKSYVVTPRERCPVSTCLRCRTCGVCAHMMECTCPFFSRGELCKHIHAVCLQNADWIAERFPKISREERLQGLESLGQLRAARNPNNLEATRAQAHALMATSQHMDEDSKWRSLKP